MSAHEVKQLVDSLKIHVEGSMPIAGVINAENGQKLSIYQATKGTYTLNKPHFSLIFSRAYSKGHRLRIIGSPGRVWKNC